MNDTVVLKEILVAGLAGADFGATGLTLPRVTSSTGQQERQSLQDGSLNPNVLRISHQPFTVKRDVARSLCALDKTYTRVDASSVAIGEDSLTVALQFSRTKGITEAEFVVQINRLCGLLTENSNAFAKQLYNREE